MSPIPVIDEHGRPEPLPNANERDTLVGFLEYQRSTLRWRVSGLTSEQLAVTTAASTMTLGGLMKHLAYVEDYWFSRMFCDRDPAEPWRSVNWDDDRDWDWNSARFDSPEDLLDLWARSVEASQHNIADALGAGDLGILAKRRFPDGGTVSLRWILCHMIEEYARHNGHADLLREVIDGVVGE